MTEELLCCRGLGKQFGHKVALAGVDLSLGRGRIIGLLGPNGSGKTTLIKLANGLLTPTRGEILINGEVLGPATKSVVSYLPDASYLPSWMRVRDLVNMFDDFDIDYNQEKYLYEGRCSGALTKYHAALSIIKKAAPSTGDGTSPSGGADQK